MIIGKAANMIPSELIGNLGDVHIYNNHTHQARLQITKLPYDLPLVNIDFPESGKLEDLTLDNFELVDYQCHEQIKAPLSN